jgi:hypothetical protein
MNKHHSGTNVLQKGGQMAVLVQIYRGLLMMIHQEILSSLTDGLKTGHTFG